MAKISALLIALSVCVSACTHNIVTPFIKHDKYGFKDLSGRVVVRPTYDRLYNDYGYGYVYHKDGCDGYLKTNGQIVLPAVYDHVTGVFGIGKIGIEDNHRMVGIVDTNGTVLLPTEYENYIYQLSYSVDAFVVRKNDMYGLVDQHNKTILPTEYEYIAALNANKNLLLVRKNQHYGCMNMKGEIVVPLVYDDLKVENEGLMVATNNLWHIGVIDTLGDTIIPFIYDRCQQCQFQNGLLNVKKGDSWLIINKAGSVIKSCRMATRFLPIDFLNFYGGYAMLMSDDISWIMDSIRYVDTLGHVTSVGFYNRSQPEWGTITPAPKHLPDNSQVLASWTGDYTKTYGQWTLPKLLEQGLMAFREEPVSYGRESNLKEVMVAYGLLLDEGNFGEKFMDVDSKTWDTFKQNTLYKIAASERLRQAAWNWVAPYYKKSFETLHPLHRRYYKEMAEYLRNHINHYDKDKVKAYLIRDSKNFAYQEMDGTYSPYRKLSAFVDRLILMHRVINVKDAQKWINKLADEVESWS